MTRLQHELDFYHDHLAELSAGNEGRYVLIHDQSVIDFFDSYEDALRAGYQKFVSEPFLVKQIQAIETAYFVARA